MTSFAIMIPNRHIILIALTGNSVHDGERSLEERRRQFNVV